MQLLFQFTPDLDILTIEELLIFVHGGNGAW